MDQSARYADLSLKEEDLIKGGRHILVAYKMKPKSGYGYLEAAAHFAAESSTGTNVEVSTTDDFTKGVDALVYYIDEASEDMRIAYPLELFDRNVTDGRFMLVSFLTLLLQHMVIQNALLFRQPNYDGDCVSGIADLVVIRVSTSSLFIMGAAADDRESCCAMTAHYPPRGKEGILYPAI